jgi:hypothetical protein
VASGCRDIEARKPSRISWATAAFEPDSGSSSAMDPVAAVAAPAGARDAGAMISA